MRRSKTRHVTAGARACGGYTGDAGHRQLETKSRVTCPHDPVPRTLVHVQVHVGVRSQSTHAEVRATAAAAAAAAAAHGVVVAADLMCGVRWAALACTVARTRVAIVYMKNKNIFLNPNSSSNNNTTARLRHRQRGNLPR